MKYYCIFYYLGWHYFSNLWIWPACSKRFQHLWLSPLFPLPLSPDSGHCTGTSSTFHNNELAAVACLPYLKLTESRVQQFYIFGAPSQWCKSMALSDPCLFVVYQIKVIKQIKNRTGISLVPLHFSLIQLLSAKDWFKVKYHISRVSRI